MENGSARILSATVSRTAQRWYCSFTVEVHRAIQARHHRPGTAIGVDLGVRTLLTGADSDGNVVCVEGPNALRSSLRRLRRASRAHSRKARGSANRSKSAARLARIHARCANVRADALHKATTDLAARYETVVCEDLNVTGMLSNRRLARAVADQGFGRAQAMLGYKTAWNGGRLLMADRWYPSSKTCSACGRRKPSLTLRERTFTCPACGHSQGRDINAARNLLALAASGAERLNACGGTVRPGLAGHVPAKQEPGTAPAGSDRGRQRATAGCGPELTEAH
jgi:putative transposase